MIFAKRNNKDAGCDETVKSLQKIVSAYLDLAQRRAEKHLPMTMEDWRKHLDLILKADGNELLTNAGSISAEIAKTYAESEFEKYRIIQDQKFISDYDRYMDELVKKVKKKKKK